MKSHMRENLISIGHAIKVIEQAFEPFKSKYDKQLRDYGKLISEPNKRANEIYDTLIALSNKKTVSAAKKLIAGESLADCSIASIYVLESRILLAQVLLGNYQAEDMLCIANDERTFDNVLEFILLGLDWKIGHTVNLHVLPGTKFIQLTNEVKCKDTIKFEIIKGNVVLTSNNQPVM